MGRSTKLYSSFRGECFRNPVGDCPRVTVRTAERFRDDFVYDSKPHQILGCHFQRGRRVRHLGRIVVQNSPRSLREKSRIRCTECSSMRMRLLDAQGEGAATAAFSDYDGDDGDSQP